MTTHRVRRIPKLRFTTLRGIGWHVTFRDPDTGTPRKVRFGVVDKADAEARYHAWLANHFLMPGGNGTTQATPTTSPTTNSAPSKAALFVPGSILDVSMQITKFDEARTREAGEPRSRGTLDAAVAADRKSQLSDFLRFLTRKHGRGATSRMRLTDLTMTDCEEFNREIVKKGYSASQVSKRLQLIKALVDRAGRPENGLQRLEWNWDSRDVLHGKPSKTRQLPSVSQLKKILRSSGLRERVMVWMGIGLGFGQSDLAEIRVGQIDSKSYDLRRGKTGIERFGSTPPLVWTALSEYLKKCPRAEGESMFATRTGHTLTHGKGDSVQQWWYKLRKRIGETPETLPGFYVLRHLGATEFGSRPQCSIGDMKRWLGHAASSQAADIYMKPVSPEKRPVIEWVRKALLSGRVDLREATKKQAAKETR